MLNERVNLIIICSVTVLTNLIIICFCKYEIPGIFRKSCLELFFKLLGLFTLVAALVSTRHGFDIRTRLRQPTLDTLTKINSEIQDIYNDHYNQNKVELKFKKSGTLYKNFYVTPFPYITFWVYHLLGFSS